MNVLDIINSGSSNLWRNKGRTFLTIIAVFIGTFTIAITSGISDGANAYLNRQYNIGGEDLLLISPGTAGSQGGMGASKVVKYNPKKNSGAESGFITPDNLTQIEKLDGIKAVDPAYTMKTEYVQGSNDTKYLFSVADTANLTFGLDSGRQVSQKTSNYEIVLASEYVKPLGYSDAKDAVGKTINIAVTSQGTGEIQSVEAKIVGVRYFTFMQGGQSIMNKSLRNKIVAINEEGLPDAMKNKYSYVAGTMKSEITQSEITELKSKLKKKGFTASTLADSMDQMKTIITAITGTLTLFGAISLLAASFGIVNTLYMSVQDRVREIGLMKALGMSRTKIFLMFSSEALMIGFWGGILGAGSALIAGHFLNDLATSSFTSGLPGYVFVQYSIVRINLIVLMIMLISFLAGTLPAYRASRLDPINALRHE
ncbi:ABC transporter permease [Enterococcus sp. DIV0187]|uniref:ABC transporter permease n=1 Tax=Enterococcus sp. DIV0187 TaxID=2774644 RepID=UPI003F2510C7